MHASGPAHVQLGLLQRKHALQHGATKWVKMLQKRRIHICHISAFHFNGTNDEHHLPSIYILWIYRYLPNLLVLVILAHFICQAAPRVADWSCDCILLATWQRTIQRRITSEISKALKDSKSVKLGGLITARKNSKLVRSSSLIFAACGARFFLGLRSQHLLAGVIFLMKDIHNCSSSKTKRIISISEYFRYDITYIKTQ